MKVSVYTGQGQNIKEIETSASTWGDLKSQLDREGVSTNGLTAVVGETEVTLESNGAQLPNMENFTLFLLPTKVKSGASHSFPSSKELFDRFTVKSGFGESDDYEESYEESYDEPEEEIVPIKQEETLSEKEIVILKLQAVKDLFKDIEDYLMKDLGKPIVENEYDKKAKEIMSKLLS